MIADVIDRRFAWKCQSCGRTHTLFAYQGHMHNRVLICGYCGQRWASSLIHEVRTEIEPGYSEDVYCHMLRLVTPSFAQFKNSTAMEPTCPS